MIAGPNGSGKSTLTEELRRGGYLLGDYINADEIAKALPGDYDAQVRQARRSPRSDAKPASLSAVVSPSRQ